MKSVYHIFAYFKKAFHINRENKALYWPQIALIIIKLFMMAGIGVGLYLWLGKEEVIELLAGKINIMHYLSKFFSAAIGILAMVILYIILSRIVEAGLYNLYKKSVMLLELEAEDFWEGVRKYFLKFVFGDLLIFAAWILLLPIYLLAGVATISIGFTVIPMIINIFLTMWKVSVVMNDSPLFIAFGDSMKFAKRHFFPLAVLQLIHWSFIKIGGGSGALGNSSRWTGDADKVPSLDKIPSNILPYNFEIIENVIRVSRMILVILIPIMIVAVAIGAVIKMVFEVFFALVFFIVYKNDFEQPRELIDSEVLL